MALRAGHACKLLIGLVLAQEQERQRVIAAQRDEHDIPHAVCLRAGRAAGLHPLSVSSVAVLECILDCRNGSSDRWHARNYFRKSNCVLSLPLMTRNLHRRCSKLAHVP
jgi:hypothetical protein